MEVFLTRKCLGLTSDHWWPRVKSTTKNYYHNERGSMLPYRFLYHYFFVWKKLKFCENSITHTCLSDCSYFVDVFMPSNNYKIDLLQYRYSMGILCLYWRRGIITIRVHWGFGVTFWAIIKSIWHLNVGSSHYRGTVDHAGQKLMLHKANVV